VNTRDIRPGLVLRVISPHGLGAARGTLAMVETVGTSPAGDWCCTIRYHEKTQTKRGRLYRSHLWAVDLGCFEVVKDDRQEQQPASNSISKAAAARAARRAQLSLPFEEQDAENV